MVSLQRLLIFSSRLLIDACWQGASGINQQLHIHMKEAKDTKNQQSLPLSKIRYWCPAIGISFVIILWVFSISICSAGTINYVDVNNASASDSNPYPSTQSKPWKTIQHAANVLHPGDTVYIKAGTYSGTVTVTNSGNAGAGYITYSAYPGQEQQAVIDHGGFIMNKASYIMVTGLKVQYASGIAIGAYGPGGNIGIYDNYTYDSGSSGIAAWGLAYESDPALYNWKALTNIVIDGNTIEKAMDHQGWNEQLDVANGVDNFEVCLNTLKNGMYSTNGGEGIDCKEGVSNGKIWGNKIFNNPKYGIYLDAGASDPKYYKNGPALMTNIEVFNNLVYDNRNHGIGITSEGRGNINGVYIYNNVIYGNGADGILLYDFGFTNIPRLNYAKNITIANNTSYGNTNWGVDLNHKYAQNVIVRDNICFKNTFAIWNRTTNTSLTIDHNVMGPSWNNVGNGGGVNTFVSDPKFVNVAGGDFHLQGDSPAVDYGTNSGMFGIDYDGADRPGGSAYDCGAYEYNLSPKYEVENLGFLSDGAASGVIYDSPLSDGEGVQLYSTETGDDLIFPIYVPTNGISYTVRIGIKNRWDRGIFQFAAAPSVDGTYYDHGSPVDEYAPSQVYTHVDIPVTFGSIGNKGFRFTVTGKNPSSSNYYLVVDYIQLIP